MAHRRAEHRRPDGKLAPARPPPPGDSSREERLLWISRYLDVLQPATREVLFLAYVERLPIAGIARRTHRSPSSVATLLERLLRDLRRARV